METILILDWIATFVYFVLTSYWLFSNHDLAWKAHLSTEREQNGRANVYSNKFRESKGGHA